MGTRELPLPPSPDMKARPTTREELLFPDDVPDMHSNVPGFDAMTVGERDREAEGEGPAVQPPLPVRDIPPPTRMARDDTSEISSAGREAPPETTDPERKPGSIHQEALRDFREGTERTLHRQGTERLGAARNLDRQDLARQDSTASHNSAGSAKESKIRHHHFEVSERLNDAWKTCDIILDTQLHEIIWSKTAKGNPSWQRRLKVGSIESLLEYNYNYAQLTVSVRVRSRNLRQTEPVDFIFASPSDKVDFLNLMKTLRADIVDALRSKDE